MSDKKLYDRAIAVLEELRRAKTIYDMLKDLGGYATVDEVAEQAKIDRKSTYYILTKLTEKGKLVFFEEKNADELAEFAQTSS